MTQRGPLPAQRQQKTAQQQQEARPQVGPGFGSATEPQPGAAADDLDLRAVRPWTRSARPMRARSIVGGFFLTMGGVHIGLVSADTEIYRHFADGALIPGLSTLWQDVFMVA